MNEALPLIWRRIPERYNMLGSKCLNCGTPYFPQRKMCPKCRRKGKIVAEKMPTEGTIYSFTEVHAAPKGFEQETPYFLAMVELSNGVRVLSQVVDSPADKIKIGAPVNMVFRKISEDGEEGVIAYGYKFKVK
ncbi:MAG: Zn-ribbon domain-containing OB-fold protein [Candidatus Micrarchaeota archaeon]|nr:Zn-ribbon domain-containing OB-fold protein [Candidatus Micrarchaeota archaeon]